VANENQYDDLGAALSAYLDGELTAAQEEKIEKRLAEDAEARQLLGELREAAELVGAVPRVRAPRGLSDRIQLGLERDLLLGEAPVIGDPQGEKHLRMRQLLATAAVVALTAGIGMMSYSVLSRSGHVTHDKGDSQQVVRTDVEKDAGISTAETAGVGKAVAVASDSVIASTAIEPMRLEDIALPQLRRGSAHLVVCTDDQAAGRAAVEGFLAEQELGNVIHTVGEQGQEQFALMCSATQLARLFAAVSQGAGRRVDAIVPGDGTDEETVVPEVTGSQVLTIASAQSAQERMEIARWFRQANTPTEPAAMIFANAAVEGVDGGRIDSNMPFFFESPLEIIATAEAPGSREEALVLFDPELTNLRVLGAATMEPNAPPVPSDVLGTVDGAEAEGKDVEEVCDISADVIEGELGDLMIAVVLTLRSADEEEDVRGNTGATMPEAE